MLIVELMTSEVMKELCLMVSVLRGRMSDFDSLHNNHIAAEEKGIGERRSGFEQD